MVETLRVGIGVGILTVGSGASVGKVATAVVGVGVLVAGVAIANDGKTPPQFSSTRARMLATEWRSLSIAELVAAKRRRFSSLEYLPLHSAKALTTISRSVGPAGVGVGVGVDDTVGVGRGVAAGETIGGAAVGEAVDVGGSAAVGDGGNAGAGEGVS